MSHREHKLREKAAKLCSSEHLELLSSNASEAFPISYNTESTQVKYTGSVISEPKFITKAQRKE